jgi:hypothetical protein
MFFARMLTFAVVERRFNFCAYATDTDEDGWKPRWRIMLSLTF